MRHRESAPPVLRVGLYSRTRATLSATMSLVRAPVRRPSAEDFLSRGQSILFSVLALIYALGLVFERHWTAIFSVAASLAFFLCFVGFKLVLWAAASFYVPLVSVPVSVDDPDLPIYTILVPLYDEANMVPTLIQSIDGLLYRKDRLEVLLLLEEKDTSTRAAAEKYATASYYQTVVLPPAKAGEPPQGKPRALNAGLAIATSEFSTIYDAEDRPDADQLLKAVADFRAASPKVVCLQARLKFWNDTTSWITRFYAVEYVIQFEWILKGLAKLGLVPPLGGTSNHFRTAALRVVGGWDPFNVTEDADLAGAFALHRMRVQILDSETLEEATATLKIADGQRRRWLKGYLQTALSYSRRPIRTARQMGFTKWFCYNLLMIGTPISLMLNPVFWGLTITYFVTRTNVIERLFPLPLYYTGISLMVAGNLILFYQLVIACLKRESYGSVKFMLLTPAFWAFMSYSCYRMLVEIINPKTRYAWNKTKHGHDLEREAAVKAANSSLVLDPA